VGYECRILADSVNVAGDRVTTMLVTYPLMVHAEFLRSRSFSYSVASNRAIPSARIIEKVKNDPFVPEHFPKNGKGMSPSSNLEGASADFAEVAWLAACDRAVQAATRLAELGVHKQIANRVLTPFQWVTQLTTGDQRAYANFFAQRCHPDAQAEIRRIAEMMEQAYDASLPVLLQEGEWHLPFVASAHTDDGELNLAGQKAVSVARSARTSYLNHDGAHSLVDDFQLHDRLLAQTPPHFSPFEHQLTPTPYRTYANYQGFRSYRSFLETA
jgi:thymidylate synthase ThyX